MNRIFKALNLRPNARLGLFFALLLLGTGALVVLLLADVVREAASAGSLREGLSAVARQARAALPVLRSKLVLLILAVIGWSAWLVMRRRQFDQLRLRRSEQKYRNIINHAGEAIFLLDEGGRVLEWNKSAETLFNEPRRNALNRPFRDIHLCYGLEIERAMADAERLGRRLTFEFPFPRGGRDGQISLTISPIATGHAVGGEPRRAFVVIARDITSEKQLESKMSETEKLAGIGQLAAGIAHQLNTPLGSILLSAQMLEESVKKDEDVEDVRRIIRQTDQCRTIIKGLLNFARPSGSERAVVNLAEVVGETVNLMEKTINVAGVSVVIEERGDARVLGNRNELDQVFFNLLANALDAMPDGGQITVTLAERDPGEIEVVFADTGVGIAAEHHDQVFLPFFTTKEYGKGTGLGLSIVARIVHEHGGRIELRSRVGEGTRFHIAFPRPRLAGAGAGETVIDHRAFGGKLAAHEQEGPRA